MSPDLYTHVPARAMHIVMCVALTLIAGPVRAADWSLDACVARTLANHPDLQAADHELAATRSRGRQATAFAAPSLSYETGKRGTPVSRDEHELSVRLSQELGAFGARAAAGAVARADGALAGAGRESVALRLRGQTTRAYRRLQADALSVRTLESLRRTAADLEQMVGARLRTGGARYLDVLRARSERARIENDLIESRRALREDRRMLNSLMARGPDEPLEAADSLLFVPLTDSLDALLRAASDQPRLRAARLEVERGVAGVALARAGQRPALSLSAGFDRVPGTARPGLGASVELSLPFVPWAPAHAAVGEARASQGGAEARLESARRDIELALRNAYESARAAEAQVQQFDRVLLADASDAIRTATQNYQAGQIDGLELLETLRTLRTIELEHIRALLSYELALTDLAVAE